MSRESFFKLENLVKPYFYQRIDTNYRKCIPFQKRLGIFLYAVGSSAEYRTIASLFGVGRTTVGEIVREMAEAIWNALKNVYLNVYPLKESKLVELIEGFDKVGFPQCSGCIGKNGLIFSIINSSSVKV